MIENKITDEEFRAISNIAKYHFYKEYVEGLEKDCDYLISVFDKFKRTTLKISDRVVFLTNSVNSTKKENKALRMEISNLKKECDSYFGVDDRKLARRLLKERDFYKRELLKLKKQNEKRRWHGKTD